MPTYIDARRYEPITVDDIESRPTPDARNIVRFLFEIIDDSILTKARYLPVPYHEGDLCENCWLKHGEIVSEQWCIHAAFKIR